MIKKRIYTCLVLLLISATLIAQRNGAIKGVVMDTVSKQPVAGATLTIMERKDSSLISFTMTDNQGRFEFRGLPNGDFRLLITHVNYHNGNKYFNITDSKKLVEMGNVVLNDRTKILEEVVVSAEAPPVTMIADTIQYNAGSFKTAPNASVEDLLKKLPGIKVEKDGTVKAQGEKVQKVLVDGKEFFGNDPKVATKNLPADAVDKVQVYDRQSDQSQLTGFDDGNSEKTINLKLKKDKKKGLFGKLMAGGGTNDRYESRFNVNSFKGARQFSAIGMANNNNAEGFSFFDMMNFSGELNRLKQGGSGGNINISINANDAGGLGGIGGNSPGINTNRAGGINYNNIIGTKMELQSNYFFSRLNPNLETNLQREYFLPDSSFFYNQNSFTNNVVNSHRLNLTADIIVDSFRSIRISPSFGYQESINRSLSDYENLSDERRRTIQGFSRNYSTGNGLNFRNDFLFRNKFRRKGRTFSLSLQNSFNRSGSDGELESVNSFFDQFNGNTLKRDSFDQRTNSSAWLDGYTVRAAYTEPIFKRSLLEFSASRSNTKSRSEKTTFDLDRSSGKYDLLNDQLTNDFSNTYGYVQTGMRFRNQRKKINYTFGVNWQEATLEGKIITANKDSIISKTFHNILPNARVQYNFTRYKNLVLNYGTNTNQPTASQLQPVPDISNPLNIREGNPDLSQEFSHMMRVQFTSLNPFKNRNLFLFLNLIKTDNKIVNSDVINNGIKTSRPVNVDGIYNLNGDISYGFPIRALKGNLNLSANGIYLRNKQLVNAVQNTSDNFAFGPDIRFDISFNDKIFAGIGAGANYNKTNNTLAAAPDVEYLSHRYTAELDWQLPKGFYFATDFTYFINDQLSTGFNARVPFWNASISKQFLRFNRGEIKLRVYDLLNQNLGISRTANQNYIEDTRQMYLRRFFLLSFTFSLNKNGPGQDSGGGMKIITR